MTHSTKRKNQSLTGNENKDCPELYVINIKTHEKREKNPDNSNIAIWRYKVQREETKVWLVMKTGLYGLTQHKLDTPKETWIILTIIACIIPQCTQMYIYFGDLCTLKHHIKVVIQASVVVF
jgi:hypothetical protein